MTRPIWLIVIGFVMEVAAIVLIVLILLQVLPSTYFLNFFAFAISVGGLFMGIIGSSTMMKIRRYVQKQAQDQDRERSVEK